MNIEFDFSDMKRIVFEAILLVCFGISVGLMFNYQLVKNAFEGEIVVSPDAASSAGQELLPAPVVLEDVQEMMH
ncbi:MAG: hypothetical protein GWN87_21675, partial [Desulfuromonadales bacterium]|nr:hypothetical protein [Desulfuromonadales bacterium]